MGKEGMTERETEKDNAIQTQPNCNTNSTISSVTMFILHMSTSFVKPTPDDTHLCLLHVLYLW